MKSDLIFFKKIFCCIKLGKKDSIFLHHESLGFSPAWKLSSAFSSFVFNPKCWNIFLSFRKGKGNSMINKYKRILISNQFHGIKILELLKYNYLWSFSHFSRNSVTCWYFQIQNFKRENISLIYIFKIRIFVYLDWLSSPLASEDSNQIKSIHTWKASGKKDDSRSTVVACETSSQRTS